MMPNDQSHMIDSKNKDVFKRLTPITTRDQTSLCSTLIHTKKLSVMSDDDDDDDADDVSI